MLRIVRSPVRLPARRPPPRIRRRLCTPSRDWRVWAAFESRDEVQKVRLASLLFDLEAMAREKQPSPAAPAVDEPVSSLDALDMVRLPKVLSAGAALDTLDQLSRGDHLHPECLLRLLQLLPVRSSSRGCWSYSGRARAAAAASHAAAAAATYTNIRVRTGPRGAIRHLCCCGRRSREL